MFNGDRLGLKKHHHRIDLLAEANALFGGIALFPQLFKALSTHQVQDLSPSSFLITCIANTIWHIYGWHRKALPVIISSALIALSSGTIVLLILFWR